jgi:homoserine acetyltransferase
MVLGHQHGEVICTLGYYCIYVIIGHSNGTMQCLNWHSYSYNYELETIKQPGGVDWILFQL